MFSPSVSTCATSISWRHTETICNTSTTGGITLLLSKTILGTYSMNIFNIQSSFYYTDCPWSCNLLTRMWILRFDAVGCRIGMHQMCWWKPEVEITYCIGCFCMLGCQWIHYWCRCILLRQPGMQSISGGFSYG